MVEVFPLFTTATLCSIVLTIGLLAFRWIWISKYQAEIPNPDKRPGPKRALTAKNLKELFKTFVPIWWRFDENYWLEHLGLDGYSYVYYQRSILRMLFAFGLFLCVIYLPFQSFFESMKTDPKRKKYVNVEEIDSISHCIFCYFFCLFAAYTMFSIRKHLSKQSFKLNQMEFDKNNLNSYELRSLRLKSAHIKGCFPEDRRGELLQEEIGRYLEMAGGRIVSLIIVPDLGDLLSLENRRKRLENQERLFVANEPLVRKICLPSGLRSEEDFENEIEKIDDDIEMVLMRPSFASGHAFVLFDSIETTQKCLRRYSLDSQKRFKAGYNLLTDKSKPSRRMTSTFGKFDDEDAIKNLAGKELFIDMKQILDPIDINWVNLAGSRGYFFYRRLFILIANVAIMVFFTTPATLFKTLSQTELFELIGIKQDGSSDSLLGYFINEFMPPLIVVSLNSLLLLLIDNLAYKERHYTYSGCQVSIFSKAVIYLLLNTVVIPALTLTGGKSLFTLIVFEGYNFTKALANFYYTDTGDFFILYLTQQGCFTGIFYLLRVGEIAEAYGSPWLAHYKRTYLNDTEKWRREEGDNFAYGYFFAQMVSAYTIVMFFSPITPVIVLPGIIYFSIRHMVDSYNLLVVHHQEMQCYGKIVVRIFGWSLGACGAAAFIYAVSFIHLGHHVAGILSLFLMVIMIFMAVAIAKPIYTDPDYIDEMNDYHPSYSDPERAVKQWEKMFSHPLLVSQIELVVQPNNRRVSFFRGESRPETAANRRKSVKKPKTEESKSSVHSRANIQFEDRKLAEITEEQKEDEEMKTQEKQPNRKDLVRRDRDFEASPNFGRFIKLD